MPLFLLHCSGRLIPIPIPVKDGSDPKAACRHKADGVRAAIPTSLAQDFGRRPAIEFSGDEELQLGSFSSSEVADAAELLFGGFGASRLVYARACFSHAPDGSSSSSSRQAAHAFQAQNDASGAASSDGKGFGFGYASQGGTDSLSSSINTATSPELIIGSTSLSSPRSVTTSPRGALTTPSLLLTTQAGRGTAFGLLSMLAGGRCSTATVSHVLQVAADGGAPEAQLQSPEPLSERLAPGSLANHATTAARELEEEDEGVPKGGRAEVRADGPEVEADVEDRGAQVLAEGWEAGAQADNISSAAAPQGTEPAAPDADAPAAGPGRAAKPEGATAAAEAGEPGGIETVGSGAKAAGAPEPQPGASSYRAAAAAPLREALDTLFDDAPERPLFPAHSGLRGPGSGRSSVSGSGSADDGGGGDGAGGGAVGALELATVPPHHLPTQLQLCLRYAYGPEATSKFVVQEAPPPYLPVKEVLSMGRAECLQWRQQVERAWYDKLRRLPPWQRNFSRSQSRLHGAASTSGHRSVAGGSSSGGGSTNEAPRPANEGGANGDEDAQQSASRDDAGPSALAPDRRRGQTCVTEVPRQSPRNRGGNGNARYSGGVMPFNGGVAVPMVPMVMAPQYGMYPQYGMGHMIGPMGPDMVPPMAGPYMMPDGSMFVPGMQMMHPLVHWAGGVSGWQYGNQGNYAGHF